MQILSDFAFTRRPHWIVASLFSKEELSIGPFAKTLVTMKHGQRDIYSVAFFSVSGRMLLQMFVQITDL